MVHLRPSDTLAWYPSREVLGRSKEFAWDRRSIAIMCSTDSTSYQVLDNAVSCQQKFILLVTARNAKMYVDVDNRSMHADLCIIFLVHPCKLYLVLQLTPCEKILSNISDWNYFLSESV